MAITRRTFFGAAYNYADANAPTVTSATIDAEGDLLTVVCNKAVRNGGGATTGWALSTGETLGTPSITGSTITFTISPVVVSGAAPTLAYTQPGNGVESTPNGIDLATFSGTSVTNNSTVSGGGTEVASDNFDAYTNGADLAAEANWAAVTGTVIAVGSGAKTALGNSGSYAKCYSVWDGSGSFNADQYAECTVEMAGNGHCGVGVRMTSAAHTSYSALYSEFDQKIYLMRHVAGTETVVSQPTQNLNSGHKMRLEVSGTGSSTRLTLKVDTGSGWTTIVNAADPGSTYIDSGKPGIALQHNDQAGGLADWAGGNL
jgi:hypothetical protein